MTNLYLKWTGGEKRKTQITKMMNEDGDNITNLTEIKLVIMEYNEKVYANKLNNLDEQNS